jgi:proteasome lid subunit RPN8/RPN11
VFKLPRRYAEEIIAHAREAAPNECCGILAGKEEQALRLYRAANAEGSPYRYSIDPQDLYRIYHEVEAAGWKFLAIYHSHPKSDAYPSATDVSLATWTAPEGSAALWPDTLYLIVSLAVPDSPTIRAFRIFAGRIVEEPLRLVD